MVSYATIYYSWLNTYKSNGIDGLASVTRKRSEKDATVEERKQIVNRFIQKGMKTDRAALAAGISRSS